MDGDLPLDAFQQPGCKPRLHELPVRDRDESASCGFVVVEVARSCFLEACAYLRDILCLDNGVAPLVVSHFPLSTSDERMLPARVSWLRVTATMDAQLQALRNALVLPLEQRGLACVDFAEFVVILANGGEARLSQACGATASIACDRLFKKETSPAWVAAPRTSASLHFRANPGFPMSDFDQAGRRSESLMAEDSLVVVSANAWKGVASH
ncbi:MAG: hypothetical protein ABI538_06005 [Pseudoxanthomonas sp.]